MDVTEHINVEATEADHAYEESEVVDDGQLSRLRDEAQLRLQSARRWIQANPVPALGIALAAGFVAGRIVRR
jgi:ElaB/YqjD/DUF883 family membrane-anchored ribosome-binding protein